MTLAGDDAHLGRIDCQMQGGLAIGQRVDGGHRADLGTVKFDPGVGGVHHQAGAVGDHGHRNGFFGEVATKQSSGDRDDHHEGQNRQAAGKWSRVVAHGVGFFGF